MMNVHPATTTSTNDVEEIFRLCDELTHARTGKERKEINEELDEYVDSLANLGRSREWTHLRSREVIHLMRSCLELSQKMFLWACGYEGEKPESVGSLWATDVVHQAVHTARRARAGP